jgi:hypothetical protein
VYADPNPAIHTYLYDFYIGMMMPTYTFKNVETDEVMDYKMSYTVLEQFKLDNPHLELHIFAENLPIFGDGMRMSVPGIGQPDARFEREIIGRIKEKVPNNTLKAGHKPKMPREW